MSRRIEWIVEMNMNGCERSGEIEVPDEATDDEIEEAVRDEVFEHISWGWSEKLKDQK